MLRMLRLIIGCLVSALVVLALVGVAMPCEAAGHALIAVQYRIGLGSRRVSDWLNRFVAP